MSFISVHDVFEALPMVEAGESLFFTILPGTARLGQFAWTFNVYLVVDCHLHFTPTSPGG